MITRKLGAAALLIAAFTATASAEERGYSATLCNASSSATNLFYTFRGVEVTGLSSQTVQCGAAPEVGANVDRIEATVYDRNPDSNLCCTMILLSSDGMPIMSATRCSAGNGNASQLLSATFLPNATGAVDLSCTIPGASPTGPSRIATYRVRSIP
jgi:hypothetical protein